MANVKIAPYTLITGASSGIGKELAAIAAAHGKNLVLVARDKAGLEAVASELKKKHDIQTLVVACDLADSKSPKHIYNTLNEGDIAVDILINNAGVGDYGAFATSNLNKQTALIDLNIRALTELTHLFLPSMVSRGTGHIMNVGSIASFVPGPLMSVYFASKAYVLSFSEALAQELKDSGVIVTCLCPGSTKTNFGSTAHVSATHSTATSHITPAQVAEFGWNAMVSGKTVAVYGASNRFALFVMRFLPRKTITRIVARIQR